MKRIHFLIVLNVFSLHLMSQGPDENWLKENDRSNRYEGSYTRRVSNPAIELISFTAHLENYEFGKKQILNVIYYLPDSNNYFLKAEELRPTLYYWMQDKNRKGKQGWNYFKGWPVDTWLRELAIPEENLGVIIKIGDKQSNIFAPCLINHSGLIDTIQYYVAKFRLGQSISKGRAVLYKGQFLENIPPEKDKLCSYVIRDKSGGSNFPIVIRKSTLNSNPGWYTLFIELSKSNSTKKIPYTFSFFHQPDLPK